MTKYVAQLQAFMFTLKNDQRGVTAIEYGLIGVAMAAMLGLVLGGSDGFIEKLTTAFGNIAGKIESVETSAGS